MLRQIARYAVSADGETSFWNHGDINGEDIPHSSRYEYDYETIANRSYRLPDGMCDVSMCGSCPNDPLIWRLLRWLKIFLFQLARSQYGMTIAFGIVPLFVGLAVGIYAGRKWEQRLEQQKQRTHSKTDDTRIRSSEGATRLCLSWMSQSLRNATIFLAVFYSKCRMFLMNRLSESADAMPCKPAATNPSTSANRPMDSSSNNDTSIQSPQVCTSNAFNPNRESGVELEQVPKHIAVIMDGNRRYGKAKYKSATRGHADGGYKLRDMVHWCLDEAVQELTVYAFSTENWNRSQAEIDALMTIFCQQCEELRVESVRLQIEVRVLSTDTSLIPDHVKTKLQQLEDDTRHCRGDLVLNVCLSYGGRGELVHASQRLASDCVKGLLMAEEITEAQFESRLLTHQSRPIDVLIRTSGEVRISNFLLWQLAYSELFFLSKNWPDLEKEDLLEVIRSFAHGRVRRFGA